MGYPYSHEKEVPIISKYFGDPEARTLKGWKKRGGYKALKKALDMSPEDVVETVKAAADHISDAFRYADRPGSVAEIPLLCKVSGLHQLTDHFGDEQRVALGVAMHRG